MSPCFLRQARTDDILAINALWPDHDLLLPNLPHWMRDPNGKVIVATTDERIIGMVHYALVTPTEAWLDAGHVTPAWEVRGVALALYQRVLELVREDGAEIARSSVVDGDERARHVLQQAGFAQIGAYVVFAGETGNATPDPHYSAQIRQPGIAELDTLWEWLERSNVASLTGGLVLDGEVGRGLSDTLLAAALEAQQVWLLEGWGEIQSLILTGQHGGTSVSDIFTISFLDGTAEGISRLASHLRAKAFALGCTLIEARPPDLLIIHDALNGAGFVRTSEQAQLLYAKVV